jgi:hypothetical protein
MLAFSSLGIRELESALELLLLVPTGLFGLPVAGVVPLTMNYTYVCCPFSPCLAFSLKHSKYSPWDRILVFDVYFLHFHYQSFLF